MSPQNQPRFGAAVLVPSVVAACPKVTTPQKTLLVLLATKMKSWGLGGLSARAERKSCADLGCFLWKFPF